MTATTTKIAGALAVLGMTALSTAAAYAAPAQSTTALNVRSGPGTGYGVVDTLLPGENVEVTECAANGWCFIQHPGPDGWVSSKYLTVASGGSSSTKKDPDINFGFGVDSNGNFSFGIGIGDSPVIQTPPPAPSAKVCFYAGANFTGNSFCVSPGASDNKLNGYWNNRISSIKVIGGTSVKVCQNSNYNGFCNTFGSSKAHLGFPLNNKITSFKAY